MSPESVRVTDGSVQWGWKRYASGRRIVASGANVRGACSIKPCMHMRKLGQVVLITSCCRELEFVDGQKIYRYPSPPFDPEPSCKPEAVVKRIVTRRSPEGVAEGQGGEKRDLDQGGIGASARVDRPLRPVGMTRPSPERKRTEINVKYCRNESNRQIVRKQSQGKYRCPNR